MTTYKLPDSLGGDEVDVLTDQTPTRRLDDYVWVRHPQLGVVQLNRTTLIEAKPPKPLPKEPPTGGAAASEYTVWLHSMNGWFNGFGEVETGDPVQFFTWPELNRLHPELRVLVYDPLANAPELPWSLGSCTRDAEVCKGSTPGMVFLDVEEEEFTPDEAEQIARAIWAGARAAREATS